MEKIEKKIGKIQFYWLEQSEKEDAYIYSCFAIFSCTQYVCIFFFHFISYFFTQLETVKLYRRIKKYNIKNSNIIKKVF